MAQRKFYVVWAGRQPGIYDNWDDAREQVEGFPGARFKAYADQLKATEAFREDGREEATSVLERIAAHNAQYAAGRVAEYAVQQAANPRQKLAPLYTTIPEVNLNAWAVDGATSRNPGPMEYRGVRLTDGKEIFHVGPIAEGTNNIAEYLAIVHALALLYRDNDSATPVYSDSRVARGWVRNRGHRSQLAPSASNVETYSLLQRADAWLQSHTTRNPILIWDTDAWGEIPADFGRK